MRPRNEAARHALLAALARRSGVGAGELADAAGISIPTLHRCLHDIEGSVVVTGRARRTRYALRRPLRGDLSALPLYEVDAVGRAEVGRSGRFVIPRLDGTGALGYIVLVGADFMEFRFVVPILPVIAIVEMFSGSVPVFWMFSVLVAGVPAGVGPMVSPAKLDRIAEVIERHWPEQIETGDLASPALWEQLRQARGQRGSR